HRRRRQRHCLRLQRQHELAADADLQERRPGAGPPGHDRLGRSADPGRDDPHADPAGTTDPEKEPSVVSEPVSPAVRRETPSTEDQMPSHEPIATPARPVPASPAGAQPQRLARSVTVERLNAWYGDHHTIKDLTLDFAANRATALIGPSGSGKSTVVRCINRMHEELPAARAEGRVLLDELDLYDRAVDVTAVRRAIGMVFQKPNPFPTMSIFDNVAAGLRLTSRKVDHEHVEKALHGAGLWEEVKDRLAKPGIGLSGGQQQRLCIARALAVEPEVLLMDEPCSVLDPISTGKIEELIFQLKEEFTIVIVTHNMQQASRVAEFTGFFLLGKLIEF